MNIKFILIIELILTLFNNNLCGKCSKYSSFDKTTEQGPITTSGLTCGNLIQKNKQIVQNMELIAECIVVGELKMRMIIKEHVF